jgi:DNA-binding LytR/AlgR family response regulator
MTRLDRMDPRRSWLGFLMAAGLGLVALFVFLDPAPSQGLSPSARIAFWAAHIFFPLALAQGCQLVLARLPLHFGNVWLSIGVAGIAASALFAPLALALDRVFPVADDTGHKEGFSPAALLDEWLGLAPPVALVWLGLNAARFLRLPADPPPRADGVATDAPRRPAFIDRLPPGRRGELVALSAELHYLRVYTTLGDSLILQGFGDALADLGPNTGLRIHRSHWIDPRFVTGLSRDGGRVSVRLATGLVLPVSRSRRAEVAAILEGDTTQAET